jgi:hypothetical protein
VHILKRTKDLTIKIINIVRIRSIMNQIFKGFCTINMFPAIANRPLFIQNTQRFGDWILSPSSC